MTNLISGGCLCGMVEFELENKFDRLYFCHCTQCRQLSGSIHAANLFGHLNQFRWLSGQSKVVHYKHPNRDFSNAFCGSCGSGVPYVNEAKTMITVRAGSLRGEPLFDGQLVIFAHEKPAWANSLDTAKVFDGFPDD